MIYSHVDDFEPNQHVAIATAIRNLVPDALFSLQGEDLDGIDWQDERDRPTDAEILAEVDEVWSAWNAEEYKRLRKPEYPPIEDYIDGVVKGDQAQIDAYIAACQAVKTCFPKPAANQKTAPLLYRSNIQVYRGAKWVLP